MLSDWSPPPKPPSRSPHRDQHPRHRRPGLLLADRQRTAHRHRRLAHHRAQRLRVWPTHPAKSAPRSRTTSTAAPISSTGHSPTPWSSSTTATSVDTLVEAPHRQGGFAWPPHDCLTAATLSVACLSLGACSGRQNAAPSAPPPAAATGSVWVADEGADSLSVIDAATHSIAMTMTGINAPHNVQAVRDGAVVYATSGADMVVAIDPMTYRVTATAPTGSHPAHVIEAPNGKVYVTNAGDGTVSVYQGQGLIPAGRITLGGMPHGTAAGLRRFSDRGGEHDGRRPGPDRPGHRPRRRRSAGGHIPRTGRRERRRPIRLHRDHRSAQSGESRSVPTQSARSRGRAHPCRPAVSDPRREDHRVRRPRQAATSRATRCRSSTPPR